MPEPHKLLEELTDRNPAVSLQKEGIFTYVTFANGQSLPDHGWKLHVAANIQSAATVLERCLPILEQHSATFKVVSTLRELFQLNAIVASITQVGKFITVYPQDEATAVAIAHQLDEATAGLPAPYIPSDRAVRAGGLVYYRYGEFRPQYRQNADGTVIAVMEGPNGEVTQEQRVPWFTPPAWAVDPFAQQAAVDAPAEAAVPAGPIGQRYRVVRALKQAARGGVYLVEDTAVSPPAQHILKEARAFVGQFLEHQEDIRDIVRREHDLLKELEGFEWVPAVYDVFEQEGNLYVVREAVSGASVGSLFGNHRKTLEETWQVVVQLAQLLADFHARNLVISDIAPGNFIVMPNGVPKIIDVEFVHRASDPEHPRSRFWTLGYGSPQRETGDAYRPTFSDDVFAFGRLVFFMLTGLTPQFGRADQSTADHLVKALRHFHPATPAYVCEFLRRCSAYDPGDRFASAAAMYDAALSVRDEIADGPPQSVEVPFDRAPIAAGEQERFRQTAVDLAESLLGDPELLREEMYLRQNGNDGVAPFCLHHGPPGVALFLRDLYLVTGESRYLNKVEQIAEWAHTRALQTTLKASPGLHMGFTGPAWLCAQLARITGNGQLLKQAGTLLASVRDEEIALSELTNGAAGIGFIHLLLARVTGDASYRERARALGQLILDRAAPGQEGIAWPYLDADQPYGFAHGAAGIGYYLLELGTQTGDERFLNAFDLTTRELLATAGPDADTGGLTWPRKHGETGNSWPWTWCNGLIGIGRYFTHAYRVFQEPRYLDMARGAAQSVMRANSGLANRPLHQCCGIAGAIEFLLDLYQVTGETSYRDEANWWGEYIVIRAHYTGNGVKWPVKGMGSLPPGFMTGSSGVASALLRLSDPGNLQREWAMPLAGLVRL